MKKNLVRAGLLLAVGVGIWAYLYYDLGQYLNLAWIKSQQSHFQVIYQQSPVVTILGFGLIYILSAALSLPGAALLTLLAGALFGLVPGLILSSFASSIGATLAFLASRFLFYQAVQDRFGDRLEAINQGVRNEGGFYLFSLRLVPLFPFFLVNLLMGLTPIRTAQFYLVSQVGMFAGTAVYVFTGTELSKLESLSGILSPGMIGAFVALGIFPIVAKKTLAFVKAKQTH